MPFLTVPSRRRMLSIAALTLAFGLLGLGGFFAWFHAQMTALQAIAGLEDIAAELEHRGQLPQAEAVLRTIVAVKDRQAIGPMFPGGLLPHEYYLSSRADLARVLSKQNRVH